MKVENIATRLETLLDRAFETKKNKVRISGSSSVLSLGFFLSQSTSKDINKLPHLVVVSSLSQAYHLQQVLEFFDPQRQVEILPGFDISPYSGLYPGPQVVHERLRFLAKASEAKPAQIFIAPCNALLQKTIPEAVFVDSHFTIKVGDSLPENFALKLQELGYMSAPLVEDVGQYAVRGGVIDLFSTAEKYPIRIELFGDQIESLRTFSNQDQKSIETACCGMHKTKNARSMHSGRNQMNATALELSASASLTPAEPLVRNGSAEFGLDGRERVRQRGANQFDRCDDANANESGDQAVLDCSCARFVSYETRKHGLHDYYSPNLL